MEFTPMFFSYQLIGDSMLLRFAEQILGLRCKYENGLRFLGYCVSGQTLKDLRMRLKAEFYRVSDKVILLIGTNDLLRDTKPDRMQTRMKSILRYIRETASEVVVLTVPPVPKLAFKEDHWSRLQAFNSFILTLNDDVTIRVADITSLYVARPGLCRMDYFEKFYESNRRVDKIHLNKKGLTVIKDFLLNNNFVIIDNAVPKNWVPDSEKWISGS
ncbi:maternal effect protein oskar-like [Anabrus simplex]|uniref:maternal effect protein oskar-like n=1 Tax=Anabrus simplex TaxID=316456 RepID=UPI0035A2D8ED